MPDTWVDQAQRDGTYLNQQAKAQGLVDINNQVVDRDALLNLRTDATLSIVAAAEYDKAIFDSLAQITRPDGTPMIPADLSETEMAHYIYIGHHEGATGAVNYLLGTIPDGRASRFLIPQNIPAGQRQGYLSANGGSPGQAYEAWLHDYTNSHVNPGNFHAGP
jgi:hypothetical protein